MLGKQHKFIACSPHCGMNNTPIPVPSYESYLILLSQTHTIVIVSLRVGHIHSKNKHLLPMKRSSLTIENGPPFFLFVTPVASTSTIPGTHFLAKKKRNKNSTDTEEDRSPDDVPRLLPSLQSRISCALVGRVYFYLAL